MSPSGPLAWVQELVPSLAGADPGQVQALVAAAARLQQALDDPAGDHA